MAGVHHTNGFGQVSEHWRVLKIQNGRSVVAQDPGELKKKRRIQLQHDAFLHCQCNIFGNEKIVYMKMLCSDHRILRQVVVSASCNCVQLHQVLKVGDFSAYPFLFNTSTSDWFNKMNTILIITAELHRGLNTHLCKPRCLQKLLRRTRAEVKQVGRPQPQDPGVHFVSYLKVQT